MTREEFCRKLKQTRLDAATRVLDITWALQIGESGLRNLENGKHSFAVDRAIDYLNLSDYCLQICHYKHKVIIHSAINAAKWIKQIRNETEGCTVRKIAEQCGVTPASISYAENSKTCLKIDMFLKLCEALDIEIKIIKKKDKV